MTLRILVVGAGIAGLAAARGLRVAGFRPDVVDELPASTVPGAGIYLPGNATRALRRLGLDAPLRPLGDLIFRQLFQDARGRPLFEMDVAALWAGVGESRALPRADLQRVLLTGVGGEVRYDTGVRDLAIVEGAAKVEFSHRRGRRVRPGGRRRRPSLHGPGQGRAGRAGHPDRPDRLPQRGQRRATGDRLDLRCSGRRYDVRGDADGRAEVVLPRRRDRLRGA